MKPRIFIGSSGEALEVCYAVQQELERDFDVTVWSQDVFRLTHDALDSLLGALDAADAGIFILRPDDLTRSRGKSAPAVRDNVIFELGMFIGRLGQDRTFMLMPSPFAPRLPSDLAGITTARFDAGRFQREPRPAVGPACTQIRQALRAVQPRMVPEPQSRARLDRAMTRMSKDLESLLSDRKAAQADLDEAANWPRPVALTFGRTSLCVEVGRIQDYQSADQSRVIALPANEYFDDECISDVNSSLGAYVQQHFRNRVPDFISQVQAELTGIPSQRVARAERRISESYGIGEAIFLSHFQPQHRLILVSATTERTGIGLRAEPHFLYAALEGTIEKMNEHRLYSLVIPVLGSGHGGMPLPAALLFNLLAARSILAGDVGRKMRGIRIVVFDGSASDVTPESMHDIIAHVA